MSYGKATAGRTELAMNTPLIPAFVARLVRVGGEILLRYGVVLVLLWIGAMKFTAYEAAAIQPLVATSPLMSWVYAILSVQSVSTLIGSTEILIALMIAARPLSAKIAALGSGFAALMFATTLTFQVSLPGWEPSLGGFTALSPTGGFLVKDLILLGAALWSLGDSLNSVN